MEKIEGQRKITGLDKKPAENAEFCILSDIEEEIHQSNNHDMRRKISVLNPEHLKSVIEI